MEGKVWIKNIYAIFMFIRHEVVGLFGLEESGSSWLDRHGLLVVALGMLGGILYFPQREEKLENEKINDDETEQEKVDEGTKEKVADDWDTDKIEI